MDERGEPCPRCFNVETKRDVLAKQLGAIRGAAPVGCARFDGCPVCNIIFEPALAVGKRKGHTSGERS